jgi:hypothetical protein
VELTGIINFTYAKVSRALDISWQIAVVNRWANYWAIPDWQLDQEDE